MKPGRFYAVGVGPGDPELLTIKGMRILESVPCVCVPRGRQESGSLALLIVGQVVDLAGKEIVEAHFPMVKGGSESGRTALDSNWNETVRALSSRLKEGRDVAFVTIGDPAFYSTFFHIYGRLMEAVPGLEAQMIPGVSSVSASALAAKMPLGLGDDSIAVIPASYLKDLKTALSCFDTVVLMKVHRVFDEVCRVLEEMGLTGKAVYVEKVGMEDERIERDITRLKEEEMSYFSLVIVRK